MKPAQVQWNVGNIWNVWTRHCWIKKTLQKGLWKRIRIYPCLTTSTCTIPLIQGHHSALDCIQQIHMFWGTTMLLNTRWPYLSVLREDLSLSPLSFHHAFCNCIYCLFHSVFEQVNNSFIYFIVHSPLHAVYEHKSWSCSSLFNERLDGTFSYMKQNPPTSPPSPNVLNLLTYKGFTVTNLTTLCLLTLTNTLRNTVKTHNNEDCLLLLIWDCAPFS